AESDLVLAQSGEGGQAVTTAVSEIRSAAERATELVRQLLTFARGGGSAAPEIIDLDLNRVVRGMESMLRRLVEARFPIEADLASDLWTVRANRGQIEQVLTNLVVNARDAMPAGGTIILRSRNERLDVVDARGIPGLAPGNYAVLSV